MALGQFQYRLLSAIRKIFFHPARFDNFKDEKISDYKTVSVAKSKNLLGLVGLWATFKGRFGGQKNRRKCGFMPNFIKKSVKDFNAELLCVTLTNNNPALIALFGFNPKVDIFPVLYQVFVSREEKSAFITNPLIWCGTFTKIFWHWCLIWHVFTTTLLSVLKSFGQLWNGPK